MPKLIVLVGPAGAGKSSYADEMIYVGCDDGTYNSPTYINQDTQGKDGHHKLFAEALLRKESIVVDRMNFSKHQRDKYLHPAKMLGYETEIVVFHVPRQVCFERIMARENHPTINGKWEDFDPHGGTETECFSLEEKSRQANSALDTFFTKYERVEDTEADTVTRLGWYNFKGKQTAVICDLDGTLCNIEHRLHHVKHEVKKHNRWDLFNKELVNDTVNEWCAELIGRFFSAASGNGYFGRSLVLCSGRVDSTRPDTENWLKKHDILYDHLFMRHRSDFRQDYIIKEIILDFEILTRVNVLFAVDDRQQVVDMWRKRGIVCLQCAPGNF